MLGTAEGAKPFTDPRYDEVVGPRSAFGGNLAIMDIYAAQKMFGRGRKFDRIDVGVTAGRTIAQAEAELRTLVGPGFQVEPPSGRGQQFEAMLAAYSMMVNISSLFALFIGMFIIYNSFAIAVSERRSEIGILRALGATRPQIRWLFLGESAVTGLIGSIGGLVFGVLIARGIAASIGALISDVYGVAQHADELATSPWVLAAALAIGIATSVIAAFIPARNAARIDPVQALQKGKYQVLSAGESRFRASLAAVLGGISVACLAIGGSRPVFYAGYVLAIVVALLLSPLLSLALANALRPLLKLLRPVEGALAADSLIQAPRRTSASVAALMLSLALVIAFAGHGERELRLDHRLDADRAQPRPLRPAVAKPRGPHDPVPGDDGGGAGGDSGRRARPDGAGRADRVQADARDDRGGRDREHRANGASSSRWKATPRRCTG